jgi:hypothetical protein
MRQSALPAVAAASFHVFSRSAASVNQGERAVSAGCAAESHTVSSKDVCLCCS